MLNNNPNLLPEFVHDCVALIGYSDTYRLVTSLGGTSFYFGHGVTDTRYARLLISAVGQASADKLFNAYGGERIYIPRCHAAMLMHRNQQFVSEFTQMVADGNSKRHAITVLCPKYKISDRLAWQLIKTQAPSSQRPLL